MVQLTPVPVETRIDPAAPTLPYESITEDPNPTGPLKVDTPEILNRFANNVPITVAPTPRVENLS